MATVTMLIGLPGSGKSAYADELVNEYPSSVYVVSSDAMRKKRYGSEEIHRYGKKFVNDVYKLHKADM